MAAFIRMIVDEINRRTFNYLTDKYEYFYFEYSNIFKISKSKHNDQSVLSKSKSFELSEKNSNCTNNLKYCSIRSSIMTKIKRLASNRNRAISSFYTVVNQNLIPRSGN